MAIIVDTCCFSRLFSRTNKEHKEFEPVLKWVFEGHGFLVYGGTKYHEELLKAGSFLKMFRLLNTFNKLVKFPDKLIDEYEKKFKLMITDKKFNDPHLPAIVRVSKCRLICSKDIESMEFVTNPLLYPKRFHLPNYYTGIKDTHLLVDENIDKRLLSYRCLLNKRQKEKLNTLTNSL